MIDSAQYSDRTILRRIFYGASELRAGWRLLIFLGIVSALIKGNNLLVGRLLPGVDTTTLFLENEVVDFLIFLFGSWIMGRIERRTFADFGLPWRRAVGRRFWQGACFSFVSMSLLFVTMRLAGVFSFGAIALHGWDVWKYAAAWAVLLFLGALLEDFLYRGYLLFTLTTGIGFWPAAIATS